MSIQTIPPQFKHNTSQFVFFSFIYSRKIIPLRNYTLLMPLFSLSYIFSSLMLCTKHPTICCYLFWICLCYDSEEKRRRGKKNTNELTGKSCGKSSSCETYMYSYVGLFTMGKKKILNENEETNDSINNFIY